MKALVQWSRRDPQGWEEVASSDWRNTPSKVLPVAGVSQIDGAPGWVTRLRTRNFDFCGYDHYAVEPIAGGGCRVTAWNDDPDDLEPTHEFYARVVEMLPCEPDPRLGGAWNAHRWNQVVYAGPLLTKFYEDNPTMNTTVRPWAEFVPPPPEVTRHGVWMPDALMEEHDRALRPVDWREWTEGVPAEFVRDGKIVEQRPLGLYDKPKGTKTFGLRNTDQASGIHAATHENEMTKDVFGAGETEDVTQAGGASTLGWLWSTLSTEPDSADWPSGNYRCSLDVSAAGADQSFGLRTAGAEIGEFARVNSGLTLDLATFAQVEALFSGAQIHVATTGTIDPAAGAAGDRFECLVAITRAANHGNQTTTMRYSADAFADGPWAVAGTTFFQTLAATAVGSPAVVKGIGKSLPATALGAAAMQKGVGKTLAVSAVGAPTLDPALLSSVSLPATAVGVASIAPLQVIGQALAAVAVGVASVTKLIKKTLAVAAAGSAVLVKGLNKALSATAVGAAVLGTLFIEGGSEPPSYRHDNAKLGPVGRRTRGIGWP